MVGLPAILLAIACLLVLVSATQPLARIVALPETVLLAGFGILIGVAANFLLETPRTHVFDKAARVLVDFPIDSESVLTIFLPILVFAGSLSLDVRRLARDGTTVLVLAVVAVVISTAAIGLAVYPFAGFDLPICLMLGAIVANTDPSAVTAIFRDIGASSRLVRLVEGEALLNDAAAISIFSLLLHAIVRHRPFEPWPAAWTFTVSFFGALVVGVAFARLALVMIAAVAATTAGEITLTLALPFITYVTCEHFLHLSGVVAVAASGLTLSSRGQGIMRPQSWRFLTELWEQLAFWAGSLVFVLASMLVPRLLLGVTLHDLALIGLAVLAALAARAAVLFGLLPALSWARLSRPVPGGFRVTIWWGGLRGAITLALALSVTENPEVSAETAHFVAVVATGFVLVTLLANGTTLRSLVVALELDRLSARDEALRRQVLVIGLTDLRDRTRAIVELFGFRDAAANEVLGRIEERAAREQEANDYDTAIGDGDRIVLALITIASRERALLIDSFRNRGLPRHVLEPLLRTADSMIDGARYSGRLGYVRAARRRLAPGPGFRVAQALHTWFRIDRPLMNQMAARYEMALVSRKLSMALSRFVRERMEKVLGTRVAEIVSEVMERREASLGQVLDAMELHYRAYADSLETRVLQRAALRVEGDIYDGLEAENLIGEELHLELVRGVDRRRRRLMRRPGFDLQIGIEQRIRCFGLLDGLPETVLHDLSGRLAIRFTVPGERLFAQGVRPRAVYLVSSGRLEQRVEDRQVGFDECEHVGAAEMLAGSRIGAGVRSVTFGHLLVLRAGELRRLVEEFPVIRENVARIDRERIARSRADEGRNTVTGAVAPLTLAGPAPIPLA